MGASEKDFDTNATAVHANGDDVVSKIDRTDDAVIVPESIRHMTDEEMEKMRKKMVRKMDAVIMCVWI